MSLVDRYENLGRPDIASKNYRTASLSGGLPVGNLEEFHQLLEDKRAARDTEKKVDANGFHRSQTGELYLTSYDSPPKANVMMIKKAVEAINPEDLSRLRNGLPTKNGVLGHLQEFRDLVIWLHADAYSRGCQDIVSLEDHKEVITDLKDKGLSIHLKEEEKHVLKALINLGKTMENEERDYIKTWDELDIVMQAKRIGISIKQIIPLQEESSI